ncbi:ZN541 protein, partial [Casuarius casuarius]|nr:ZN541 protein [Casuarius casuarius]
MDQYRFGDENAVHSETQLSGFSDAQGLNCSDTLNHDLCLNTREMTYAGLSGLDVVAGLSAADMASDALEANLNGLFLCSVKDCDSVKLLDESDSDSQPSLRGLGLPTLTGPKEVKQGGRSNSGPARKGKHQHSSPQTSFLDCSLCGKVFSSASSLTKHYLTHSQERKHVCRICSKAFKRQDHLSGHMLTHQKTKPFMCLEKGCTKSYCDHRSLRRHYEVQHGLCALKEAPDEDGGDESLLPHNTLIQAGQGGVRPTERLTVHSESKSDSSPPKRDLLRCIVNNFVNQKLPSAALSSAEHTSTDLTDSWPPCSSSASQVSCAASNSSGLVEAAGDDILKDHLPCQKSAAASNVYAIINPGNVSVIAPGENTVTNLTDRSSIPEPQFPLEPAGLEYCPSSALPCFPIFRGQKTSQTNSHQSSGNFQWMRNVPVCAKNKRNSVCGAHKPPLVAQDVSEGLAGPSHTFSAFPQTYECPDTLSFAVAPFKAEEEALGDSTLSCPEEAFRSARSHDSHPWESSGESSFQDIQKQNVFQNESGPLVRQLFVKSQESVVSQEQVQVQQHLLQMITKSQHILSHAQMVAPSQLVTSEAKHAAPKPLQAVFQQPPHLAHQLPEPTEYDGSSTYLQKSITQLQKDVLSDNEKRGQQTVPAFQSLQPGPLKECTGLKDASVPSQVQPAVHDNAMGCHSYGKSNQLENKTSMSNRKEKSKGCSKETGGKTQTGAGRSRRLPGIRKEKLRFDATCTASPSQVAMASFSSGASPVPAFREKPRLTIFNRIQGGNIYSLTNTVKEESLSAGCNKTSDVPTDGGKYESGFLCKNCSQLFYTEKGLESHMCFHSEQWYSPERKEEQQVHNAENVNAQKLLLQPTGDGSSPSKTEMRLEDVTVAPLVIPVSVPVTATNPQAGNEVGHSCVLKVNENESQDAKDLKESLHQKKRKRQIRPKSLFIPPPPSSFEVQPGTGGCYQSNLRSPVFLVDHLLRDLFQCSPYTPPPMISPIREGSGLYFSTLCSSANGDPNQLFSTVLDRMDRDFGFCLVKDNTKISIEPHINIGSRFQAEIPNLQDRSYLESDEQAASLVWKPWGDIATNQETQDRVTELLNMACSSVMPGGGTNLELALHCLHEAQGNVLEALEMLLFGGPQKSESHPLANYRYAGSDIWTPVERQLFKKAFCVHKKDFYLIQKKIQTKNVSQCVEYYYIWKKIIKFDYSRVQVIEKKVKKDKNELEKTEEKTACSPPQRNSHLPKEGMKIKQKNYKKMPHGTWSPSCSLKGSPYRSGSTDDQCAFPCRECERVFDKIKSRNAHMKRHRLQEQVEPLMKIKWPLKHFK